MSCVQQKKARQEYCWLVTGTSSFENKIELIGSFFFIGWYEKKKKLCYHTPGP